MSNKSYKDIVADTAGAKRGVVPDHLVDTYGDRPPRAAEFRKGISDQAGAQEAQNARREVVPAAYDSTKR
jgi:hypothetical protein